MTMESGKGIKILLFIAIVFSLLFADRVYAVDEEMLNRMERIIQMQQEQIDAQAKDIKELRKQLEVLTKTLKKPDETSTESASASGSSEIVRSRSDKVSVQLYGQVNRAFMYVSDGDSSETFSVDNDTTSSRLGVLGKVKANDDTTVGMKVELEYQQNPSDVVSQIDKNNVEGDSFTDRHIDVFVDSKKFGKLSVGKGDTASNGSSEVDLSGTDVVAYSLIAAMSGGILFYDNDTGSLSDTNVNDVFNNFDGLTRDDRVRYDTPAFYGFKASASVLSGSGGDVALRYSAKLGDYKIAAAAAWADPNNEGSKKDIDNQYSGSASVLHSSGLNLTVAGGWRDYEITGRDDPTFFYAKLGFRKGFFKFGESMFSIDYALNNDVDEDRDDAESYGLHFVQDFSNLGTEYFLAYRYHDLDRPGSDFDEIDAIMSGFRVKF